MLPVIVLLPASELEGVEPRRGWAVRVSEVELGLAVVEEEGLRDLPRVRELNILDWRRGVIEE